MIGRIKAEVSHQDGPWWGFEPVGMAMLELVAWYNQGRARAAGLYSSDLV